MCGIFGVVSKKEQYYFEKIKSSLDTLLHRGPDDFGIEKFNEINNWDIWLGHRRLAIIDTTTSAHQPMVRTFENNHTKEAIVFNGEIYNFKQLKESFKEKWNYISSSDTEVLFSGMHFEGKNFLTKMNGMWAFAHFSEDSKKLVLSRDRLGKKPLYIYKSKDLFVFSSELKPIISLNLKLTINETALSYYHMFGYIPADMTIYNECNKLKSASYLEVDLSQDSLEYSDDINFWDPLCGFSTNYQKTYSEAKEEFLALLDNSTQIRLQSDVPIGVFLSGGVDSSLIVSSLKSLNITNVNAYTVKFDDPNFDESKIAIDTCQKLDIPLKILNLHSSDYQNQISKLSYFYDEPFSDSSQIPTMAISELASKHVKVVLTGDGGDEVFLGYPRFSYTLKLNKLLNISKNIPLFKLIILSFLKSNFGKYLFKQALSFYGISKTNLDSKISRVFDILESDNIFSLYDIILSVRPKHSLSNDDKISINLLESYFEKVKKWYSQYNWNLIENRSIEEKLCALDLITYMKDDVLVKVDRATMAYSLEARSPLLDYRIVEFGFSLPIEYKIRNNVNKVILRDSLYSRVPGNLSFLPKKGFGVPLPINLGTETSISAQWNTFIQKEWCRTYNFTT